MGGLGGWGCEKTPPACIRDSWWVASEYNSFNHPPSYCTDLKVREWGGEVEWDTMQHSNSVTLKIDVVLSLSQCKSKVDKFSKITNWVKLKNKRYHSKVLLNSFPTNGHTVGFCPKNQKFDKFVSPKVSLCRESKG